jgi:hypothetical protein
MFGTTLSADPSKAQKGEAGFSRPSLVNTAGLVVAGAILCLTPAIINGGPFLFYDSAEYFNIGGSIVSSVIPEDASAPSATLPEAVPETGNTAEAVPAGERGGGLSAIAGNRSALYSSVLFIFANYLNLWLLAGVQATVIAWLIIRFLDFTWGKRRPLQVLALIAGLSLFTGLGYHAAVAMPDVFAGIFLICAMRLALEKRMSALEAWFLRLLLVASVLMHTTIAVLAIFGGVLIAIAAIWPATRRHVNWRTAITLFGAAIFATIVGHAFVWAAERASGGRLGTPPFISARVIADGPGKQLLQRRCKDEPASYAACMFAYEDYADHNAILWGDENGQATFSNAGPERQEALQKEQTRFVFDVLAHYPVEQIAAAIVNTGRQLAVPGLDEIESSGGRMTSDEAFRGQRILALTPGLSSCLATPGSCKETIAGRAWSRTVLVANLIVLLSFSAVMVAWMYARFLQRRDALQGADPLLLGGGLLALSLLFNAAVCGALSAPHDRYETRLMWVIALFLAATASTWLSLFRKLQPSGSPA